MSMNDIFKELKDYCDVVIDREFAIHLIPVIEMIMTNTDTVKKISYSQLNYVQKMYIKFCENKEIETDSYKEIMNSVFNTTRYKIHKLLETLYDIVEEDSPAWNTKWKIKCYSKIEYDEVESDVVGIKANVLKPKPEYAEKVKKNEKIMKYNVKQREKCIKWRKSNVKFYKKILEIINN